MTPTDFDTLIAQAPPLKKQPPSILVSLAMALAAVLVILLLVLFAGCGGTSEEEDAAVPAKTGQPICAACSSQ